MSDKYDVERMLNKLVDGKSDSDQPVYSWQREKYRPKKTDNLSVDDLINEIEEEKPVVRRKSSRTRTIKARTKPKSHVSEAEITPRTVDETKESREKLDNIMDNMDKQIAELKKEENPLTPKPIVKPKKEEGDALPSKTETQNPPKSPQSVRPVTAKVPNQPRPAAKVEQGQEPKHGKHETVSMQVPQPKEKEVETQPKVAVQPQKVEPKKEEPKTAPVEVSETDNAKSETSEEKIETIKASVSTPTEEVPKAEESSEKEDNTATVESETTTEKADNAPEDDDNFEDDFEDFDELENNDFDDDENNDEFDANDKSMKSQDRMPTKKEAAKESKKYFWIGSVILVFAAIGIIALIIFAIKNIGGSGSESLKKKVREAVYPCVVEDIASFDNINDVDDQTKIKAGLIEFIRKSDSDALSKIDAGNGNISVSADDVKKSVRKVFGKDTQITNNQDVTLGDIQVTFDKETNNYTVPRSPSLYASKPYVNTVKKQSDGTYLANVLYQYDYPDWFENRTENVEYSKSADYTVAKGSDGNFYVKSVKSESSAGGTATTETAAQSSEESTSDPNDTIAGNDTSDTETQNNALQ